MRPVSLHGWYSSPSRCRAALFLACLGAAGAYFGLPGNTPHVAFAALLIPAALFVLASSAKSIKESLFSGWLLGFFVNAAGLYWLVFPLHDVAGAPFFLALPAVLLLHAVLGCYFGLACFSLFQLQARFVRLRPVIAAILYPLSAGAVYGGFEVLCGTLFTGFPWLSLASAFSYTPEWLQSASLFGSYALSAIYAATACLIAQACLKGRNVTSAACVFCAAAILGSLYAYGEYRCSNDEEALNAPTLHVVLVQGNVDQTIKWEKHFQQATLSLYQQLSLEALDELDYLPDTAEEQQNVASESPVTLVLWPETAMPFYFDLNREFSTELRNFAAEHEVWLAFGSLGLLRKTPKTPSLFNRLYLLSPDADNTQYYDKEHLVPFGEYTPFAADIPFLRNLLQGIDFSAGKHNTTLHAGAFRLGALICYEAIFPELAQERVRQGAEVLVNISNDGWFRKSSAPHQHLAHAVLRAVEQSRPFVRSTNTGISAIIDNMGRISTQSAALFTEEVVIGEVSPQTRTTLFHRIHPVPEVLLALLALFPLFGYMLQKLRRGRPQ